MGNCKLTAVDLVIGVDSTQSESVWADIKRFAVSIVDGLNIGETNTRVGFFIFGRIAIDMFYLNRYSNRDDVVNGINNSPSGLSYINVEEAFSKALYTQFTVPNGDRQDVPNVLLIVTAEASFNEELGGIVQASAAANARGIRTFSVGINTLEEEYAKQEAEVKAISSPPQRQDKNYLMNSGFASDLASKVLASICDKPCLDVYHTSYCTCPSGQTIQETNSLCSSVGECNSAKFDLVFIIGQSNAIFYYDIVKLFVVSIIDQLPIGPAKTQVGMLTIDYRARRQFYLNKFSQKTDIVEAILALKNQGSSQAPHLALIEAAKQFTFQNGDRSDAPNVVVVISYDGITSSEQELNQATTSLVNLGTRILSVGIQDLNDNEAKFKAMSSKPQELNRNYFLTPDIINLSSLKNALLTELCGGGSEAMSCRFTDKAGYKCFCHDGKCNWSPAYATTCLP